MTTAGFSCSSIPMLLAIVFSACSIQNDSNNQEPQLLLAKVEAHHLKVRWCPQEKRTDWTFAFGENPNWELNATPPAWPGNSNYSYFGPGGGGAGGSGRSHFSSRFANTPYFWVHRENIKTDESLEELQIRIHVPNQPKLLKMKFLLGEPPSNSSEKCISVPVLSVSDLTADSVSQ